MHTTLSPRRPVLALTTTEADEKMALLQDTLRRHNIRDLGALGKLAIPKDSAALVSKGITKPTTSGSVFVGPDMLFDKIRMAHFTSGPNLNISRGAVMAKRLNTSALISVPSTRPVPDAYWIADIIEIGDNTTVLFTTESKYLAIVANKISIGKNVQFTWREPDYQKDVSTPIVPPKQPQTQHPDNEDQVIHGNDGAPARTKDLNGQNGKDAPFVEFWTLDFKGNPVFLFAGQDGQDGGDGGDGGGGQDGANGCDGKFKTISIFALGCDRLAGSGGNGGRGGGGGNGGNGGNGGKGGKAEVFSTAAVINDIITQGLHVELHGGEGGRGGRGGNGGNGGRGGKIGRTVHSDGIHISCGPKEGAINGSDGTKGRKGLDGRSGTQGSHFNDSLKFSPIEPDAFNIQFNKPFISRVSAGQVFAGDLLTLKGDRFTTGDQVLFNQIAVMPESPVKPSEMVVKVPDLPGGEVVLSILQPDGTTSNLFSIVIKPFIQAVVEVQTGLSPARFKPGTIIRLTGTGFASGMTLRANDATLSIERFVSKNEIRATLTRPFGADEKPGPDQERVTLKLQLGSPFAESNDIKILLDTFKILVSGDSIQWGQGLQEHQKAYSLVEAEIARRLKGIGIYKTVLAHSGAIVGDGSESQAESVNGEVPHPRPTMRHQLAAGIPNGQTSDETLDLLLLNGGMNDIGVFDVISPLGPDLVAETLKSRQRMHALLTDALAQYPNARIVYGGYFDIVSASSNMNFVKFFLAALGFPMAGIPGVISGLVLDDVFIDTMVRRCRQFRTLLHDHFRALELELNASLPQARVFFADPAFTPENAIFAPQSFLFSINEDLSPVDHESVAIPRGQICERLGEGFICKRASVGHPNPAGAEQYARQIIQQIFK